MLNIVLVGATGVGKSSLVNAIFGKEKVKAGTGKPITQYLEKIIMEDKGVTLWDTKGIEAKDYESTMGQIKNDLSKAFKEALESNEDDLMPHIAWLCIKESSGRIEPRDFELLEVLKSYGIPTLVVLTDTRGDKEFFETVKKECQVKGYEGFLKDRFVAVNSVVYKIGEQEIKQSGLKELLEITEDCITDVENHIGRSRKKYVEVLKKAQEVAIEKRLQAMIEGATTKVHIASATAGSAGAIPIPMADAPIIAAIQAGMIYSINAEFELQREKSEATAIIALIMGTTGVAQLGKAVVSSTLKFIPGVGSLIGGAVSAATAAAITEAIGHAYIQLLVYYFNKATGEVDLPNVEEWQSTFKELMMNIGKKES